MKGSMSGAPLVLLFFVTSAHTPRLALFLYSL
jgi:hypothetical protein